MKESNPEIILRGILYTIIVAEFVGVLALFMNWTEPSTKHICENLFNLIVSTWPELNPIHH